MFILASTSNTLINTHPYDCNFHYIIFLYIVHVDDQFTPKRSVWQVNVGQGIQEA